MADLAHLAAGCCSSLCSHEKVNSVQRMRSAGFAQYPTTGRDPPTHSVSRAGNAPAELYDSGTVPDSSLDGTTRWVNFGNAWGAPYSAGSLPAGQVRSAALNDQRVCIPARGVEGNQGMPHSIENRRTAVAAVTTFFASTRCAPENCWPPR